MPSLLDRLRVVFYLTPAIFILLVWLAAFSTSSLLAAHGLTKILLMAFGLSVGISYFIVLAVFRVSMLLDNKF